LEELAVVAVDFRAIASFLFNAFGSRSERALIDIADGDDAAGAAGHCFAENVVAPPACAHQRGAIRARGLVGAEQRHCAEGGSGGGGGLKKTTSGNPHNDAILSGIERWESSNDPLPEGRASSGMRAWMV